MTHDRATLVYVNDGMPGWRRVRRGRGFSYRTEDGSLVRNPRHLERIRKLAIPPAYTDVWICPSAEGHLQATARDARGRKQYRYHALWQERRKQENFARMRQFGEHLPALRRAVQRDLSRGRPDFRTVVAAIVRLLDLTALRIGNDEYRQRNGSYGLSTLKDSHAHAQANRLRLGFKGKSGVMQEVSIEDGRVARIVRRCQELPGQRLFQFQDDNGDVGHVHSEHVNDYLRCVTGEDFTAKDFRTWHASVCAMGLVLEACADGDAPPKPHVTAIVEHVARQLGNTCAVCRKFYIHPDVLRLCDQDVIDRTLHAGRPRSGLSREECALLALLRRQAAPP